LELLLADSLDIWSAAGQLILSMKIARVRTQINHTRNTKRLGGAFHNVTVHCLFNLFTDRILKTYLSYKSISAQSALNDKEKVSLFKANYINGFKTFWPYAGVLLVILICFVSNQYSAQINKWLFSAITGSVSGFIYFQFHCRGIEDYIANKEVRTSKQKE